MNVHPPRTGAAGPRGPGVRADCWIAVTPAARGGLSIEIKSKVGSMYGRALRELVEAGLGALELAHAAVEVEDGGALPFTVAARLEAAARRALPDLDRQFLIPAPPGGPPVEPLPRRERLRRSRLYLPGNEPRFMPNAGLHRPDAIILDLEDSVAPAVKDEARLLVRNALHALDFGGAERMVRVNQLPRGLEDLPFVVPHGLEVVLIPKCESAEEVRQVERDVREIAHAAEVAPPFLMPIVESARGALHAAEIAAASDLVAALTIGLEDYTADLGATKSREGAESFWARSTLVAAARAAGVQPIDSVYGDIDDMEGLRDWGERSRALGFVGMGCIHPRQIPVIHQAFAPTPEEIERAVRIVEAFEAAQAAGLGVVALGSKMIDAPVVKRAQFTVQQAREMGLLREES